MTTATTVKTVKTVKKNPILFCSHRQVAYETESWRHIFSQWYNSGEGFIGNNAVYDLSDVIQEDDWNNMILNKKFMLREQWMMYLKAIVFAKNEHRAKNLETAEKIMKLTNPGTIKKLGRVIEGYDEETWNECKYKIVVNGNYLEFTQNDKMKKILLDTGNREIAEASHYDAIWGIGLDEKTALVTDRSKWGSNLLGKAIMEVRGNIDVSF